MAFEPTREQELAINTSGSIIVSAAAGSGKTAVLVERVIRMLTNKAKPVMADKLLVVTFTNAAAAELRLRIEKRLDEELAANPDSLLLQKQHILISNAKICTIDSFCIDFMRENFERIGISPSFKIADNVVLNTLQKQALSETFNYYFDSKDTEFLNLFNFLGDDYDDSTLQKTVHSVFEFSRHMPFPKIWFNGLLEEYKNHAEGRSEEWFCAVLKSVAGLAEDALIEINQGLKLLELNEEAYEKYGPNLLYYSEKVGEILRLAKENKWNEIFAVISAFKAPAFKRLSADSKTREVELAVAFRDNAKKIVAKMKPIIYATKEEAAADLAYMYPFICKIVEIVLNFEARFYAALKENDLITFYIAEQTVIELLAKEENGRLVAADDVSYFTEQYDAVLVDEYQDTNTLQDTLFNILSNSGEKLFCVGDIKQCIYKFRGSNPLNFLAKKQNAKNVEEKEENDMLRIDLGCNFRSRKEVCEFVNSVFSKLVYTETSDFEYDEKEMLVPKAKYPDNNVLKVENHFVDYNELLQNSDVTFESKLEAEAYVVADIIEELVNKEPFLRDGDLLRKARYGDIAILIRSMRGKDEYYINALKDRGIPVSVSVGELIDSDEVNTLISLLKVINNPSDDIAILTLLTSPVFMFSMNELAEIRAGHKYGSFYSSMLASAKGGNKKSADFIKSISVLRRRSTVLPIGVLIDEIFEETNILNIYSSKENGEIKRLNLLCVQNLSVEFDEDKNKDISSFLKFFQELDNRDFSISAGSNNGVKIMSIHKSKGLQFPICIIANTTNKFNERDIRDNVIVSEEHGFSCTYYDDLGVKKDNTVLRTLMKVEEKRNLLAEELRVFYVALTRAEEKLITLSTYDSLSDELARKKQLLEITDSNKRVAYSLFKRNNCYADWLCEALLMDGAVTDDNEQIFVHKKVNSFTVKADVEEVKTCEINQDNVHKLKEIYSFKYPYEELLSLQAKASVTDIVHKADEKQYRFTTRPAFMQAKGLSSAERGTAMHKVMQMADFESCKLNLDEELLALYESLVLSQAEYDALDKELFKKFFGSELCRRIINSKTVKREMKFITEFAAGEISEGLSEACAKEPIVVQGAVDLLFIEGGEIVIVDFKSDRNKNEYELISAYENQLKIYAKACSKLMGLPVKEMLIYSYSLGKEIKIK